MILVWEIIWHKKYDGTVLIYLEGQTEGTVEGNLEEMFLGA